MHSVHSYVGQTLDDKYRLERLLGQGGMGAVYLATHLGTGRAVAVKLITPAFMRRRVFVERFKREARAAGRLRHPNIVDVTDFGFTRAGRDSLAYLVMEYLDGCTLNDVLEEERILPLPWVVGILEQVCSAVHEAHKQGIVHRDLKPDNIWLEPNPLGGYHVKVLDFGIAKVVEGQGSAAGETFEGQYAGAASNTLEEPLVAGSGDEPAEHGAAASQESATILETRPGAETGRRSTDLTNRIVPSPEPTVHEAEVRGSTEIDTPAVLAGTDVWKAGQGAADLPTAAAAAGLTHVGALVGTPRFMSPEQCRGEHLDARSDIYSLGVIAYQMLSGTTPFTGTALAVIRAHLENQPPSLRGHNRRLPVGVSTVIMSALAKDPAARPQSALAFANSLRANATGLGPLYRRAFALYCEHFPKVLLLSLLAHVPVLTAVLLTIGAVLGESRINDLGLGRAAVLRISIAIFYFVASFVASSTIAGVTAILVTQLEVAPLRQVELRTAFDIIRRRWRPFLTTGLVVSVRLFLGLVLLVIPGMVLLARSLFWAPVVLMEGLEGKQALARSRALASRSWPAITTGVIFLVLVDQLIRWLAGTLVGLEALPKHGLSANVLSKVVPLASIFYLPLLSMVPALLYLKMRELGGETLTEVMAQLEAGAGPRTRWEKRLRARLSMNTPSKST